MKGIVQFYLATGFFWFALYAYIPTLSPYIENMGVPYRTVGLVVGAYGFTQMLLRIPLGIWADTLNRRKPFIMAGLLFASASGLGLFLAPSVGWAVVARSMAGVAAATWVPFAVLFASYFPLDQSSRAMGLINACNGAGQVSGMLLGALAAERYGMGAPFIVACIGGLVGFAFSLRIVDKASRPAKSPPTLPQLLSVGTEKGLLCVSLLGVLIQLLNFGTVYGFTPLAAQAIGATNFQLGVLTTLGILPGIFASALSGTVFSRIWGERLTIVLGFSLVGLSSLAIPYVTTVGTLYVVQTVGGFSRGMVFPLLMGLSIRTVAADKRATAMGFFQAIYGLGMFTGPVLVGLAGDAAGLRLGFWVAGIIGLFSAALTQRIIGPSLVKKVDTSPDA